MKKKISLNEFSNSFFQPTISIKSLFDKDGNPLYKSLPNWRRNHLLPFIPKGDWGMELSMSQIIWLQILDELRALGFPVKITEKVTDYFFRDAYFNDLPTKNLKILKDELLKKGILGTLDEEDAHTLNEIEKMLGDSILLYGLKFEISYLSNLVSWCIKTGQEAGILIFADGKVVEKYGGKNSIHGKEVFITETSHIYISIRSLIREFINDKDMASIVDPHILEIEEMMVIRELRKKNIKELRIVVQSEKIVRIDSQTIQPYSDELTDQIKKILRLKNYEEVTISTYDSRVLNFKRTTKQMITDKSGSNVKQDTMSHPLNGPRSESLNPNGSK